MPDPVDDDPTEFSTADPEDLTNVRAMESWAVVVEDMDATAAAYEDEGWETATCHPGDVTVTDRGERRGVVVLLPGDEYEAIEGLVESATFDDYEVLRAESGGLAYAVVVMRDTSASQAFLVPLYYDPAELADVVGGDGLAVYLGNLQGESVELRLDDPGLFVPDD